MKQTRRDFLKTSTGLGVAYWVGGGTTASSAYSLSANEEVQIACIGVGGKGSSDTSQAGNFGQIVALCDIDGNNLNSKANEFPNAKTFFDYREMLKELGDKIDAVTVSTADHTHAPASIMAMRMGKHVYCQKPLTHTPEEARIMRTLAAEKKLVTQMGNQGTAHSGFRQGVEALRAGVVGAVTEVHVWTNRPVWPQAPDVVERLPEEAVPEHVKWDLFLGPAPVRPYNKGYHPFNWRGWWDYGTGALGDMACHTANLAFMGLELTLPTFVSAKSGEINPETYPAWATFTLDFPARGKQPPVKFVWYEGKLPSGEKNLPPKELMHGETPSDSGLLLKGEKGVFFSPNDYGAAHILLPKKEFEGYKYPTPSLARHENDDIDNNMKREWVAGIKGGPAPLSNFDYAGNLTEAILLGNVALRVGRPFHYEARQMKTPDSPTAEGFIKKAYREGFGIA